MCMVSGVCVCVCDYNASTQEKAEEEGGLP